MIILNVRGRLKMAALYRDSIENPQFGGQKSKLSKGNFLGVGRVPPLLKKT